jgi:ribosome biogenesis protein MAK21
MGLVSGLLVAKPEQEHNLLRLLANKLGDSERSVASKASYHLLNVLQAHPQMKGVIVKEVSALILKAPTSTTTAASDPTTGHQRPQSVASWNAHARYFAVITFNQIVLSKADKEVASKLVDLYFELFKWILGEGKETDGTTMADDGQDNGASNQTMAKGREGRRTRAMDNLNYTKATGKGKAKEQPKHEFAEAQSSESKVISAILTGVNRAVPFAGVANETWVLQRGATRRCTNCPNRLDKHVDTLFRISHSATFNVSIQALVLMQQISTNRPVGPLVRCKIRLRSLIICR